MTNPVDPLRASDLTMSSAKRHFFLWGGWVVGRGSGGRDVSGMQQHYFVPTARKDTMFRLLSSVSLATGIVGHAVPT